MGVSQSSCVSLRELEKYTSESYTVNRTSGDLQDGWRISTGPHYCGAIGSDGWVGGHANKPEGVWRVFMEIPLELGDTSHAFGSPHAGGSPHACGWRRHGTFFPTRIKGQDNEINSWHDSLLSDLEALQAAKKVSLTGAPKTSVASIVEAAVKADKAKAASSTETDFAKNLFMTVQGVKHDALCPHGLPYYACMSCSH